MVYKFLDAAYWKGLAVSVWPALLFVGLYFAGADLGHQLSFSPHFPSCWPPSGILLAALVIFDLRRWPTVILLALATNLVSDVWVNDSTISLSVGHWFITTFEAVIGACILRRFGAHPFTCESLREVLTLSIPAAAVTTLLGALLGEMLLFRELPGNGETMGWVLCWNSHMLGVIVFAPVILTLAAKRRSWSEAEISGRHVLEALAAFVCLIAFAHLVYSQQTQPYAFLVFPVLIWIALRFEIWGTCVGNLVRVVIAIWSTRLGHGPFAGDYPATEQAVILNSFLSITSATAMFLAAVISERRRSAHALRESELRHRDLLENIGDLVHSVNADGTLLYTNRAWRETLGYSLEETQSLSLFQVVHPDDLPRFLIKLACVLSGRGSDRYEFRFLTKDGRTLMVEGTCNCRIVEGEPNATRSIYRDVTSRREHEAQLNLYHRQLEAANAQLQRLATTDGLTGLHNRRAFHTRLNEEVERAERHGHDMSLLIMDVDHFKQVNDVFGHPVGDKVLQRIAQVLSSNARDYDFAARIGGEEFAVILPETNEEEAIAIAERLRERITTVSFPGRQITASVGVATLSLNSLTGDTEPDEMWFIKAADAALYHSKQNGRNRVTHASSVVAPPAMARFDGSDSGAHRLALANL